MKTKRQMDEINARNPSPELYNIASLNMKEIPLDRSGKKQFPERPIQGKDIRGMAKEENIAMVRHNSAIYM